MARLGCDSEALGIHEVQVVPADMLPQDADVVEDRPAPQHRRSDSGHPRSGEYVEHHIARLRESLDERLDRAYRDLSQVGMGVVDGISPMDVDFCWNLGCGSGHHNVTDSL